MADMIVTFDVFSALIDSRAGGTAFFSELAGARSWAFAGELVFDRWDAENKRLHSRTASWQPFSDLAEQSLASIYTELSLGGDPGSDCAGLLASMAQWPLWPDVTGESLTRIGHPLGLLSNIDDALLAVTAPLRLGCFDPSLILTSERLRAYKPAAAFYAAARQQIGPLVHVASSARDVRGALEAGLRCLRLARPGHQVDPAGPRPPVVVETISQISTTLMAISPGGSSVG